MYKHIIIETKDNNQHNFFNAVEFEFDEKMQLYKVLTQNGDWQMFPAVNVNQLSM